MTSTIKPKEVADTLTDIGIKKTKYSTLSLIILGFLAGCYIAFAAFFFTVASQDMAQYVGVGLARVLGGLVFSIGLMLVIIAGSELFTGNTLMTLALFKKKIKLSSMLRNWSIVYTANFAGSLFIVIMVYLSGTWTMNNGAVSQLAINIASLKTSLPFMTALVRGILCNWLVCLAVWLATASKNTVGKVITMSFPIIAFVVMGFEHSIANMFFIPFGILLSDGAVTVSGFLGNIIPVTIGNIIGSVIFVAGAYFLAFKK